MNAQDCLQTLREIKDVSFATVDQEGHPQIRIIDVMLVRDGALYFCTSRGKDFHAQLLRDPHVAIVGMTRDFRMVRLAGEVRFITNDPHAWIDRIFDQNPSMNDVYPGQSRYVLDPFVIDSGCVEIFDLGVSPHLPPDLLAGRRAYASAGISDNRRLHRLRHVRAQLPPAVHRPGRALHHSPGALPALRTVL